MPNLPFKLGANCCCPNCCPTSNGKICVAGGTRNLKLTTPNLGITCGGVNPSNSNFTLPTLDCFQCTWQLSFGTVATWGASLCVSGGHVYLTISLFCPGFPNSQGCS